MSHSRTFCAQGFERELEYFVVSQYVHSINEIVYKFLQSVVNEEEVPLQKSGYGETRTLATYKSREDVLHFILLKLDTPKQH